MPAKEIKQVIVKAMSVKMDANGDSDFFAVLEAHALSLSVENRDNYALSIMSTKTVFRKFLEHDEITFDRITPELLTDFRRWYVKTQGKLVSANKHLRNIKLIFNKARREKIVTRDLYPFDNISIQSDYEAEIRALNATTVAKIASGHSYGCDMFMLSFYLCGMNFADIVNLSKVDGDIIDVRRMKTQRSSRNVRLQLTLQPEVKEIIERYAGLDTLVRLPQKTLAAISRATNNDLKLVSIKQKLEFCTLTYARHSWATIASSLGVSDSIIDRALMHSQGAKMIEKYRRPDYSAVDKANRMVIDHIQKLMQSTNKKETELK